MKKLPLHKRMRFETKLVSERYLTPTVKELYFSCPEDFIFTAGQYITLQKRMNDRVLARAYSIASSMPEDGKICLTVKWVKDGKMTEPMFRWKVGEEARILGPMGHYVFESGMENCHVVFIATGTGIAPFRSMLGQLSKKDFPKNVFLILGVRHLQEMLYLDEWERYKDKYEQFDYRYAISSPEVSLEEDKLAQLDVGRGTLDKTLLVKALNTQKIEKGRVNKITGKTSILDGKSTRNFSKKDLFHMWFVSND